MRFIPTYSKDTYLVIFFSIANRLETTKKEAEGSGADVVNVTKIFLSFRPSLTTVTIGFLSPRRISKNILKNARSASYKQAYRSAIRRESKYSDGKEKRQKN